MACGTPWIPGWPGVAQLSEPDPGPSSIPAVSVLMPCFNAESTLDETLASLFHQTLPQFEIVAVDDGSTDGTWDRLRRRSAEDSRLHPMLINHAGIVAALNAGLAACRGPLIARMDADALAPPEHLAAQRR